MSNLFKVLTVLALVVAVMGLLLPAQAAPPAAPAPVLSSQSVCSSALCFEQGGGQLTVNSGGVINVETGGALQFNGVAQSGALRYGTASNVISGTTVAHGFGTTPTMFIPRNYGIQAAAFTQTIYGGNCGAVSCTIYVSSGSVTTVTASWIAGQ